MPAEPFSLDRVFQAFNRYLHERQQRGSLNKEDAVRYTFFHALTTAGGLDHASIFLETAHTGFGDRKEIDLLVPAEGDREGLLVEFKFDRRLQTGGNLNRTARAAALLFDLHRLSMHEPQVPWRRLMVYVSDGEMVGHFRSPRNGLARFFDGPEESDVGAIIAGKTGTTFSRFNDHQVSTRSRVLFAADQELGDGLSVRVFEVTASALV